MIHHQVRILPELPRRELPSCEVLFHDRMSFFGLAASFMMPVDELAPFSIHVGRNPEELVLGLIEADGLEGEIIHPGQERLLQPFPEGIYTH
jgi:hypothetical protein